MAIGQMFSLSNPYIPPSINTSFAEINTIQGLKKLNQGKVVYYVNAGPGDRPEIKTQLVFHSLRHAVSPHYPKEGLKDYFVATQLVEIPGHDKPSLLYRWIDTKFMFVKPYQAIFTSKDRAVKFLSHVSQCYESDPDWHKWLSRHQSESVQSRRYFRDMVRIVNADEGSGDKKKSNVKEY